LGRAAIFNLLTERLISVTDVDARRECLSLPQLYERLAADAVASFPALRPHQRHAWHALLCQLGALACIKNGLSEPPRDASDWLAALRALTPDYPDDEPWRLVTVPDKPAFLQPPQAKLDGFKPLATPDELDMLVTAKNHDVKAARLATADLDDWLFALVTLQTMEGFLGRGNYGVSRMNGGFANRPGFSIAPPGGVGAHMMRDIRRLIAIRDDVLERYEQFDEDGLALIWLEPWDGATSLSPRALDPYYIEICRRVRLIEQGGRLSALAAGSKAARISFGKDHKGDTGDPWTPLEVKGESHKALTIDARGLSYKRLSDILFENGFSHAPLQQIGPDDRPDCEYVLVCRALARGQGRTDGLHERRIIVPPKAVACFRSSELDPLGNLSKARIEQAGKVRSALRYGLMILFQNGPDRDGFKPRDSSSAHRVERFLDAFEKDVDRDFFNRLFVEFEAECGTDKHEARRLWLLDLRRRAESIIRTAEGGSPQSTLRRYRAFVRAERSFRESFYKNLGDYFRKERPDAA
jgi:CRISPR system Cascade subunit CasA